MTGAFAREGERALESAAVRVGGACSMRVFWGSGSRYVIHSRNVVSWIATRNASVEDWCNGAVLKKLLRKVSSAALPKRNRPPGTCTKPGGTLSARGFACAGPTITSRRRSALRGRTK